jgi:hypothetical protein
MAKRVKIITPCPTCGRNLLFGRSLKIRQLPKLEKGLRELGLECVHCNAWHHRYYETEAMRARMPVKPEDREAYGQFYDAEQERIKGLIDG